MLSSLLPLGYLSPLRSLTGISCSSDAGFSVEDDAPSGQRDSCDDSVHSQSQYLQPSMFSIRDTPASTDNRVSGYNNIITPCASLSLDLASASAELDTFSTSFFEPSTNNADRVVNELSPLPTDGVLQNVLPPAVSPAPLFCPQNESLSLSFSSLSRASPSLDRPLLLYRARMYSPRFPSDHLLNAFFLQNFRLDAELGSGGYGFVMAASRRIDEKEVAVKFIVKSKVPEHAWTQDSVFGHIPTEILLLTQVDHPYIAKCLDLYEDDIYYYLVQEIHGTPWVSKAHKPIPTPGNLSAPELTPSSSGGSTVDSDTDFPPINPPNLLSSSELVQQSDCEQEVLCYGIATSQQDIISLDQEAFLDSVLLRRPEFSRRASHDLFECIEQSPHKRLSETQARYVFAQIVEAVAYLDARGITHCDIKDENILIDLDLNVKLIDFGSAVVVDPTKPRPYYNLFFGTTAYASSEVLRKKPYRAAPAEIWTLGVLLSYLLTGHSPFPTEDDAREGRVMIRGKLEKKLSRNAVGIMKMCLEPDPERRATIKDVSKHRWLAGALDR